MYDVEPVDLWEEASQVDVSAHTLACCAHYACACTSACVLQGQGHVHVCTRTRTCACAWHVHVYVACAYACACACASMCSAVSHPLCARSGVSSVAAYGLSRITSPATTVLSRSSSTPLTSEPCRLGPTPETLMAYGEPASQWRLPDPSGSHHKWSSNSPCARSVRSDGPRCVDADGSPVCTVRWEANARSHQTRARLHSIHAAACKRGPEFAIRRGALTASLAVYAIS